MAAILVLKRCVRSFFNAARNFSDVKQVNLSGIFPPLVVPFNDDESIAYDKLELNFVKWSTTPFKGYVVHGSNGEFVHLTVEEKISVLNAVKKLSDKSKLIIAGVGCDSKLATLKLIENVAKLGANAALIVNPYYYKSQMTNPILYNYYTEVADSSSLPVIIYNVPANTGIDMQADLILKLSSHPNIIGMKDSGGDFTKLSTIISQTENFQILAGSASFLLPAYSIGCVGGICALANVLGPELCELHKIFHQGDLEAAKKLHLRLIEPNAAITKKYGVGGLKFAMERKGFYGGKPRLPLLPASEEAKKAIIHDFEKNGF